MQRTILHVQKNMSQMRNKCHSIAEDAMITYMAGKILLIYRALPSLFLYLRFCFRIRLFGFPRHDLLYFLSHTLLSTSLLHEPFYYLLRALATLVNDLLYLMLTLQPD